MRAEFGAFARPYPPRTNMLKSGYDAVLHPISSVSMLLKHKDGPGAAAPLTVQVVVTLSGRGPESVTLTVETQGQMTKRARKAASDPRDPATQEGRAWWEDKPAWLQPK